MRYNFHIVLKVISQLMFHVVTSICLNDPPELKNPDDQYAPQYKSPVSGLKSKSWLYPVTFANPKFVPIAVVAAVLNQVFLVSVL